MALDPATVRRIAKLARIRVTDEEVARLQIELSGILGWIEQLNEVDVSGVAPLSGVSHQRLPMREDKVTDGGKADAILANAPARADHFFTVPKVVE
jgi:aspartyl-tRNA(Asn)/glutamyl-tRNA(Gln) amidotransferase subunit C